MLRQEVWGDDSCKFAEGGEAANAKTDFPILSYRLMNSNGLGCLDVRSGAGSKACKIKSKARYLRCHGCFIIT